MNLRTFSKIKLSLLLCLFVSACSPNRVENLMNNMTVEEKVGQLFMVGGLGKHLQNENLFKEYHFGNIFLGYVDINNLPPEQIIDLTNTLQEYALKYNNNIPLLISTDQEGGVVNRVKKGVVIYPSQEYIGKNVKTRYAKKAAKQTAIQLRALGINTNFSPVADVNTNTKSHIAKHGRSFSSNPKKAAKYVSAYLSGYKKGGIIGCVKHFPGYGDVLPDPHKILPSTNKTYEELKKCELIPYFKTIRKTPMIMTAHISVPNITKNKTLPATISKEIMDDILRKKLKFKGVIITDDFNMGAIEKDISIENLSIKCINSGVDIILFVGRPYIQRSVYKSICDAVKSGKISEQRLNESVSRILKLKHKYSLFKNAKADKMNLQNLVNTKEQLLLLENLLK